MSAIIQLYLWARHMITGSQQDRDVTLRSVELEVFTWAELSSEGCALMAPVILERAAHM